MKLGLGVLWRSRGSFSWEYVARRGGAVSEDLGRRLVYAPDSVVFHRGRLWELEEYLKPHAPALREERVGRKWRRDGYELFSARARSWAGTPRAWRASVAPLLASPPKLEGLKDCLYVWQEEAVRRLYQLWTHGCHPLLADEMGLGKTVQALSLLGLIEPGRGPSLVVAPAIVLAVWQQHARRFFPDYAVVVADRRLDTAALASEAKGKKLLVLSSYTQLRRCRESLSAVDWASVVLDEAQYIRNFASQTSRSACGLTAHHRLALTGTPLENRLEDVWSIFRFLMPNLLGSLSEFRARVREEGGVENLKNLVAPFVVRRTKKDVLKDLPEKSEALIRCPLTPTQRQAYDDLASYLLRLSKGTYRASRFLTGLLRLRQICCDVSLLPSHAPLSWEHSGKLRVLRALLEPSAQAGEKVVIFSQFVSFLFCVARMARQSLPALSLLELNGGTPHREAVIDSFQNAQGPVVLLASLKLASLGIALHCAKRVFIMDPWWNPAVEEQAISRVHRQGAVSRVFAQRLVAENSLEESIQRLQHFKRFLSRELIGLEKENWSRHLQALLHPSSAFGPHRAYSTWKSPACSTSTQG